MKTLRFFWIMILIFMVITLSACSLKKDPGNATSVKPRFAYVANDDGTISIYTVDATTGKLRHNGYVVTGYHTYSVTVDPSGRFAYAGNSFSVPTPDCHTP
ncbi:MAG: hypothetical protein NTV01_20415, partial [Bacteroidia bacterium]|nr:hypothetical protein [Bacteroidia bacterium]